MSEPNFWNRLDRLTLADLESLRTGGVKREKINLDFKQYGPPNRLVDPEGLGKDLCAFANAMGGRIVYGAVDDGADGVREFAGIDAAQLRSVRSTIRNTVHAVQPPPVVDLKDVPLADGKLAVVIDVRPGLGGPHQYRGTYWLRSVDGTVPMPHTMVVQSVLSAHQERAGEFRYDTTTGSSLVGSPFPFGETRPGFYLGVEVRAAYPIGSSLCDPLSAEAGEIRRLCSAWGYKATRIGRMGVRGDWLEDSTCRRLRFQFSGLAEEVEMIGPHETWDVTRLVGTFGQSIRRLGRLFTTCTEALQVQVRVDVWATGGPDMRLVVVQRDLLDAAAPLGRLAPQAHFSEVVSVDQPVSELLDPSEQDRLAERAFGLLVLELEPISR